MQRRAPGLGLPQRDDLTSPLLTCCILQEKMTIASADRTAAEGGEGLHNHVNAPNSRERRKQEGQGRRQG